MFTVGVEGSSFCTVQPLLRTTGMFTVGVEGSNFGGLHASAPPAWLPSCLAPFCRQVARRGASVGASSLLLLLLVARWATLGMTTPGMATPGGADGGALDHHVAGHALADSFRP